jgi:hypothetical protein
MRRASVFSLLLLLGCTSHPIAAPSQTPTETASPSPSVSPSPPVPAFSATDVVATIRELVTRAPYREAASAAYRLAAGIVRDRFRSLGYTVRSLPFPVPAGKVNKIPVKAGTSTDVIASPPGYDPRKPHLVVGGHLDTVPNTPGANDDASGPAVILELARLARITPTKMPVVFVAFGAEERRRQSPTQSEYALGSKAYLASLTPAERRSLKGMINIDMVGAGPDVQIIGTTGSIVASMYAVARRSRIPVETHATITQGFSDHITFQAAGIPAAWLWAGDNPTLHTPRDTMRVIQSAELQRIGAVAWETLRSLSL